MNVEVKYFLTILKWVGYFFDKSVKVLPFEDPFVSERYKVSMCEKMLPDVARWHCVFDGRVPQPQKRPPCDARRHKSKMKSRHFTT